MPPHGAATSPRVAATPCPVRHLPASTSASAAPATYTENYDPVNLTTLRLVRLPWPHFLPTRAAQPGRPLFGAGRPGCDLYRIAALLMLIEEIVDQSPILPLAVNELGGSPAAAATHRRRPTSAVVRGEHARGALAWCLDGAGPGSNRKPAERRASAPLRLERGRACRRISRRVLLSGRVPQRADGAGAAPNRQGLTDRAGRPAGRQTRPGA
jgi:hypothetical protein